MAIFPLTLLAKSDMTELPNPPFRTGTTMLDDQRAIGWAEFGDPDGDVVFWFPGTPGARTQVPADLNEEATARHLRVICVERPGTGDSTPHRHQHVVDFVADFEAVTKDLGIDRYAVVGLSGGGPFTLAVAWAHPEQVTAAVVLGGIGPTRGVDSVVSHTMALIPLAALLERIEDRIGDVLAKLLRGIGDYGDPVIDAFFWTQIGDRDAMAMSPGHKRQLVRDLVDAANRGQLAAPFRDLVMMGRHWGFEIGDVRVPVTFFGGTSDPIVPYFHAERQSKRVPGARLRTVQNRGHFAGYTEVGSVLDVIREQWPALRAVESTTTPAPTKKAPTKKAAAKKTAPKQSSATKAVAKKPAAKRAAAK